MPYTHFHDWSIHTHHQRPRGGRHYNAIRRRQRPWKVGFFILAVVLSFWVANEAGWLDPIKSALSGEKAESRSVAAKTPSPTPEVNNARNRVPIAAELDPALEPTRSPTTIPESQPPAVPELVQPRVTTPARADAPTETPSPTSIPKPTLPPHQRHLPEKELMLSLINDERARVGAGPVVLGDNIAAQLHAESALSNCFSGHWSLDGLKPYMRYSLAGGYQSNGENGHGSDYCIKASDGYRPIGNIQMEIREAMAGWMGSPGHRRNILDPSHMKVNIGIAWDRYNVKVFQHFEGDYVEYQHLPGIDEGVLKMSGRTKNGARLGSRRDLGVQIYYDPPPAPLTPGQVARTYCYDNGLRVAGLRERLTGGSFWPEDRFTTTYSPCPDPADVPADAPPARSPTEANRLWEEAYDRSRLTGERTITVPWIDATKFHVTGGAFDVEADISEVLDKHGDGVYSVLVWGLIDGQDAVLSEYSIFHGVPVPDTYHPGSEHS